MRLAQDQVEFFERFAKSPEAAKLRQMLQAELDDGHKKMRTLEGAEMHRAQGAAILLDTLIANLSGQIQRVQPPVRLASGSRRVSEDVWA